MIDRRTFIAALPVSGCAMAASASPAQADPILALYHQWREANAEWVKLINMPGNEDFDWPESLAAERRADRAMEAMLKLTPTTVEGIAALTHVLWYLTGPAYTPDHPDYAEQCQEPANRAILAIWRAASSSSERPTQNGT